MNSNEVLNPTFIGIGGMRCGTTWLSECLRYHPEIFMSIPKEIHFFGNKSNWDKGVEWYRGHFRNSNGFKAVGEFSVSYLYNPISAEQILDTIGQVKIIAVLRNPIERFVSHYKYLIRSGGLLKEKYQTLNIGAFRKAIDLHPNLIKYGNYYLGLKTFIDIFGIQNVCLLTKECIDKDPRVELERIYDFLEVNTQFAPPILNKKVSPGIIPRFPLLESWRTRLYYILNNRAPQWVIYIRKLRLAEIYRKINSDTRASSFKIDDRVIEELYSYYYDDIVSTERLMDKKRDVWKR